MSKYRGTLFSWSDLRSGKSPKYFQKLKIIMNNKSHNTLRTSFNSPSFRTILKDNLGHKCINCNSDTDIEYHHIVPLSMGGTNRLSNIVPLCHRCHMAAHYGQHISHYKKRTKKTGRKRKVNLDETTKPILWMFAKGEIGESECREKIGLSKNAHLKESIVYKEFLQENDICRIKNRIDTIKRFYTDYSDMLLSKIVYTDGLEEYFYGS